MRTKLSAGPALVVLAVIFASIAGWVMNLAEILATVSGPITAMFILRCVGVFVAPFGAILGP